MLLFHEDQERTVTVADYERRHREIEMAVAKSGLLSTGKYRLIDMFPQFVKGSDEDDNGPVNMRSDIDPKEAERISLMIERQLTGDTGSLGFDDLFTDLDEEFGEPSMPMIDERVRNGN